MLQIFAVMSCFSEFEFDGFSIDMTRSMVAMCDVSLSFITDAFVTAFQGCSRGDQGTMPPNRGLSGFFNGKTGFVGEIRQKYEPCCWGSSGFEGDD